MELLKSFCIIFQVLILVNSEKHEVKLDKHSIQKLLRKVDPNNEEYNNRYYAARAYDHNRDGKLTVFYNKAYAIERNRK